MQFGNLKASTDLRGAVLALDVDGVILDDAVGGSEGWVSVLGTRFGVNAELLRTEFFGRSWTSVIRGQSSIEVGLKRAIAALGWTMTVEEVLSTWFEVDYLLNDEVIEATIRWSKQGVRVVLVTNQEHRRAQFLRRRLSEILPFRRFIYSADIGFVKADLEFYPIADVQIGTSRQRDSVVFVDDTAENVEAACRHGWRGIHFEKSSTWQSTIDDSLHQAAFNWRPL